MQQPPTPQRASQRQRIVPSCSICYLSAPVPTFTTKHRFGRRVRVVLCVSCAISRGYGVPLVRP